MAEKKNDPPSPEFEPLVKWITGDWAHEALLIFAILFVLVLVFLLRK